MPLTPSMPTPRVIDDKYELLRQLGEGGMGKVFEARHLRTGRHVAVKVIRGAALEPGKRAEAVSRFEREARAVGRIESPHVVSVFDTGVDAAGDPYLVMELLRGEDLRGLLRRGAPLAPDLAARMVLQACLGLQAAHDRGVVHRDIKTANLYLARRDRDRIVTTLLDFGIAKLRPDPLAADDGHDLTRSGSVLGSPLYMAPEQAIGAREVDVRADIWSLGIVLYEALTGTTPHEPGTLGSLILAICSQPPRSVCERAPWVGADLAKIVQKALMLDPAERFQSAEAMGGALVAILGPDSSIRASELPAPEEQSETSQVKAVEDATPTDSNHRNAELYTTAEPFTLRSQRAEPPPPGARAARRPSGMLLVAVGGLGLVVAAAAALDRSVRDSLPEAHAGTAATSPGAVNGEPAAITNTTGAATPPALPEVPVRPPARSSASAASPVRSSKPPRQRGAEASRSERKPVLSLTASATSALPPPETPPASPPEPGIDRQFD
jgi:eukaryotic-like serine/threonine-protein kinase